MTMAASNFIVITLVLRWRAGPGDNRVIREGELGLIVVCLA